MSGAGFSDDSTMKAIGTSDQTRISRDGERLAGRDQRGASARIGDHLPAQRARHSRRRAASETTTMIQPVAAAAPKAL